MYKHHSYNKLIERKLEQLPSADTDSLWSSMEAILDQQMPQKKRRPGLIGWLFAHKAWMLTALSVVSVTGATLAYISGNDSGVAKEATTIVNPVSRPIVANATIPAAASSATKATGIDQVAAATNSNAINNIINPAAAPVVAAARTSKEVRSSNNTVKSNKQNTPQPTIAAPASPAKEEVIINVSAAPADAKVGTDIQWAATTNAITISEVSAPSVNPAAVHTNTETLQHLVQQIASADAAAKRTGRLPQGKGLYAGVVAGLDMSSVEFGSIKTGNNMGLILGYAFNNHWSMETGLQWNRKKYGADGDHYKPDGFTPQPGLTILSVNNVNQLYEWPVNVKYNILAGRNKLFVTGGVSSYFLKKEAIDLHYEYNGQQGDQYDVYSNVSKHWLSVANFSLGYTHKLGSFGSIRVEPYLKLPLRDMGVGNMRVTSTGLNVGFTKMLRR